MTTRKYIDTVRRDLQGDVEFRRALLTEIFGCMASGDVETGKSVLRTYIDSTIGFEQLGVALGRPPRSLVRMLAPAGNPNLRDFFEIVAFLQKRDGAVMEVVYRPAA